MTSLKLGFIGGLVWMAGLTSFGAAEGLTVAWTNNLLTVSAPNMPGNKIEILYLEAFCRRGSTKRVWSQTTIRHQTELLFADPKAKRIRLRSKVEPQVEVLHDIRAQKDEVEFHLVLRNHGEEFADIEWLEPCIRVHLFTSRNQTNYVGRCFIFTDEGLARLDQMPRNEEALYRGGQVYVPKEIDLNDVNPRPISPIKPANGLIGCFSNDDQYLLATAWNETQHLFQGVFVCIHNDPHVGGLKPGETKTLRGKLYFLKNDPKQLLARYQRDFPAHAKRLSSGPREQSTILSGNSSEPVLRMELDSTRARLPVLSWDTEGGNRFRTNLLRADTAVGLRVQVDGKWHAGEDLPTQHETIGKQGARYRLSAAPNAEIVWEVQPEAQRLNIVISGRGTGLSKLNGLELASLSTLGSHRRRFCLTA